MGKYPPSFGSLKNYGSASISPDECKKRQSGFWTHEYRVDKDEEVWRCDRHRLDEAVRTIMMDYREAAVFQQDPHRYLDTRFGEGTAYVYFTKHKNDNPYFDYRTSRYRDLARGRDMAYWDTATSNTFTTTTTSGTADSMYWMQEAQNRMIQREVAIKTKQEAFNPYRKSLSAKRLVKLPFKVETGSDLLSSLQRQFDQWAGQPMERLYG